MNVLVAVKGREPDGYYRALVTVIGVDADLKLVHVVDERLRADVMASREALLFHHDLPDQRRAHIGAVEQQAAERTLSWAQRALEDTGVPATSVRMHICRGKPERELVRLVADERCSLVVVCARERPAVGPKSIGKVARFVIDHAGASALIIRAGQ